MKRHVYALLAAGLLGCCAAASACTAEEPAGNAPRAFDADASASIRGPAVPASGAAEGSRIAVVYFSEPETEDRAAVMGSTEFIAQIISTETGGRLVRIERTAPYPASHEALTAEAKGERDGNIHPAIRQMGDFSDSDVIFLGNPIWWYDMPMPVYSFLDAYDLSGKTIIPFVTHGGSGLTGTADRIAAAEPGARVAGPAYEVYRADVPEAEPSVLRWLTRLGY